MSDNTEEDQNMQVEEEQPVVHKATVKAAAKPAAKAGGAGKVAVKKTAATETKSKPKAVASKKAPVAVVKKVKVPAAAMATEEDPDVEAEAELQADGEEQVVVKPKAKKPVAKVVKVGKPTVAAKKAAPKAKAKVKAAPTNETVADGEDEAADGQPKKRKRTVKKHKKKKDEPKNGMSAFMWYCKEMRPTVAEMPFAEQGKALGAMWKEIKDDPKQIKKWVEEAAKDKIKAEKLKAAYAELHKDDPPSENDDGEPSKKRTKKGSRPPRGKTAWLFYLKERQEPMKQLHPEITLFTDRNKLIAAEWKQMTDDDKQPYNDASEEDKVKELPKRLAQWEADEAAGKHVRSASKPRAKKKTPVQAQATQEDDEDGSAATVAAVKPAKKKAVKKKAKPAATAAADAQDGEAEADGQVEDDQQPVVKKKLASKKKVAPAQNGVENGDDADAEAETVVPVKAKKPAVKKIVKKVVKPVVQVVEEDDTGAETAQSELVEEQDGVIVQADE